MSLTCSEFPEHFLNLNLSLLLQLILVFHTLECIIHHLLNDSSLQINVSYYQSYGLINLLNPY